MKKLLTLLLCFYCGSLFAQGVVVRTGPVSNNPVAGNYNKQVVQDANLKALLTFGTPFGSAFTLNNATGEPGKLFYNTSTNKLGVYNGTTWDPIPTGSLDFWTINSNQTGLTGDKTTSGTLNIVTSANSAGLSVSSAGTTSPTFIADNTANTGIGAIQEWKHTGQIRASMSKAGLLNTDAGFSKTGSSNSFVLLGGGGTIALSSIGSGTYLPLTGGNVTGNVGITTTGTSLAVQTTSNSLFPALVVRNTGTYHSQDWLNAAGSVTAFMTPSGSLTAASFINSTSSDSYVLLGGGGTALLSSIGSGTYVPINGSTNITGQIGITSSGSTALSVVNNSASFAAFSVRNNNSGGILQHWYNNLGNSVANMSNAGNLTATSFITIGGTSSQVVLGDGTLGSYWGSNPMTSVGDIIQGTTSGAPARLASIATGNVLLSGGVTTANLWGKVGLTTHVTGTLPIANGGTGSATQNFVDLTSSQSIGGNKSFSSAISAPNIGANTWIPTFTMISNMTSVSRGSEDCYYLRINNIVFVRIKCQATPTGTGSSAEFEVSLPIGSDLGIGTLNGTGVSNGNTVTEFQIYANPTTNSAVVHTYQINSVGFDLYLEFTYRII